MHPVPFEETSGKFQKATQCSVYGLCWYTLLTYDDFFLRCSIEVGRNICHGSDSVENAKKEIALWFDEGEVLDYKSHSFDWIYE